MGKVGFVADEDLYERFRDKLAAKRLAGRAFFEAAMEGFVNDALVWTDGRLTGGSGLPVVTVEAKATPAPVKKHKEPSRQFIPVEYPYEIRAMAIARDKFPIDSEEYKAAHIAWMDASSEWEHTEEGKRAFKNAGIT